MNSSYLSTSNALPRERQQVLRNTYGLLALTMVPTVAGAGLGLATPLGALMSSGILAPLVALAVMIGFIFAIQKNRNSASGVYLLLGFTFLMGVMLSGMLGLVLGQARGAELVLTAFLCTGAVFSSMAVLSSVVKRSLAPLGTFLFVGVIALLVAGLANLFFQSGPLSLALSSISAIIFSLFLLVDLQAVRDGRETSYVSATLGVYLSLFNVFTSVLHLLAAFTGED